MYKIKFPKKMRVSFVLLIAIALALTWATTPPSKVVYVFGVAGSGKTALIRALCNTTTTARDGRYDCPPVKATIVNTPGFGTPQLPMVYSMPEDMSLALLIGPSKLLEVHRAFIHQFWQLTKQHPTHLLMVVRTQSNASMYMIPEVREAVNKYLWSVYCTLRA